MRGIALALFAGLALVAAAIVVTGYEWHGSSTAAPSSASSWSGYEDVVRAAFAVKGSQTRGVRHVAGPYYMGEATKGGQRRCFLMDVSNTALVPDFGFAIAVLGGSQQNSCPNRP